MLRLLEEVRYDGGDGVAEKDLNVERQGMKYECIHGRCLVCREG